MNRLAIITTTYRNDLDWCRILCESIDRFVPVDIMHYLFVDNRDISLFRSLENNRRRVISQNEIIPWWLLRLPFRVRGHNFRISPVTLPVRGWIAQQVVKLGVFEVLDEDVFLCLDSEAFFFRPFNPASLFRGDKVMMVRHEEPWDWPNARVYYSAAHKLLGVKHDSSPMKRYMSVQFIFRREVLKKLAENIRSDTIFGSWKIPLFNTIRFSEYTLYGIFVERILGFESSGHFPAGEFLIRYIGPKSYGHRLENLEKLLAGFEPLPGEVGILLQKGRAKKKGISPDAVLYEGMVQRLWERLNK
ncbi:MAG TPA: DUF6492 family protein [Bacteroidales bacterium]|nr:DUF6492 family protein [Bacteroidales bacterium]HQK71456.1 DUF6492 family protein [Bacteroidales bacterium]